MKGLTAEHGRFNSNSNPNQSHQSTSSPHHEPVVPVTRRQSQLTTAQTHTQRNPMDSFVAKSIKRETDMILHSTPTALANYAPQYMPPFMPQLNYPEHPRKRSLKSPYADQESSRGSVLRDGSKGTPVSSQSPVSAGKRGGYGDGASSGRPASSASSAAPTEADTQQMERNSPQQSK